MSKTSRTTDLPTQPAVHEPFADTMSPEDYYTDSVRGMLDEEFSADVPREKPTFIDRVIVVSVFGAGLAAIWCGIGYLVRMFGG